MLFRVDSAAAFFIFKNIFIGCSLQRRYQLSGSKSEIERLRKRVEILETRVENLMRNAGIDVKVSEKEASDQVMELLLTGNRVGAVKAYRRETGASLKSARDFVDSLRK